MNKRLKGVMHRDGSYTRTRKTRPEPASFIVGMGMKN